MEAGVDQYWGWAECGDGDSLDPGDCGLGKRCARGGEHVGDPLPRIMRSDAGTGPGGARNAPAARDVCIEVDDRGARSADTQIDPQGVGAGSARHQMAPARTRASGEWA